MSTDPRVEKAMELIRAYADAAMKVGGSPGRGSLAALAINARDEASFIVESHVVEMAAEISRLTAELADEKAVNEHQRSELQDRVKKQRATDAELEEARKDAGQLEEQCEELTPAQKLLERVIKEDRHLLVWVEARSRRGGPTLRELIKKGAR